MHAPGEPILVGLAGCVLPGLPGVPLIFISGLVYGARRFGASHSVGAIGGIVGALVGAPFVGIGALFRFLLCAEREQLAFCECGLALQDGGCAHQAPQSLPFSESVTEDQKRVPQQIYSFWFGRKTEESMVNHICVRCGVQYAASVWPPARCAICEDEREAVNWKGQRWTTLADLRRDHRNIIQPLEPDLIGIHTELQFAIGQQALLIQTPEGNVLWDCLSLIDDATIASVRAAGELIAIASSHPHFYGALVEWSRAFDGVPIYLHAADQSWVMRPDPALVFWEGATYPLAPGLTLIHCGGHFAGSTVLHWAAGAGGRGALCTGDTLHVVEDHRYVTFMYSYVNYIPLSGAEVRRITEQLVPFSYDRIYGCFAGWVVASDAQSAVATSASRYLRAIGDA